MVTSTYLLRRPAPPRRWKRFFDQRVMPITIDAAAFLDMGAVRASEQVRRNPVIILGVAVAVGCLIVGMFRLGWTSQPVLRKKKVGA
jgi:hypothetical protein